MRGKLHLFLLGAAMITAFAVMVGAATAGAGDPDAGDTAVADKVSQELEPADSSTLSTKMADLWESLRIKWEIGGNTMWAIGLLAVITAAFALDRLLNLRRSRIAPRGLAIRANMLWQKGQYGQIKTLAWRSKSSLGRIIFFMVEHRSNSFENINAGAEDIAARDLAVHTRRNYPLSAVGTIAPLLGLMGTVFGLMGAFATIGAVGSMDDPATLADDVSKALITTAAGLILAVLSLGLYHFFKNRTSRYAGILGEEASNLMNAWFLKKEDDYEGQTRRFR